MMVRGTTAAAILTGIIAATTLSVTPAQAAITGATATNTATTVTYTYQYTGAPAFRRVYVNTDRATTGFTGGGGAEFMLENTTLFLYTGDGSSWAWEPFTTVAFTATNGTATWTVDRADLGELTTPGDADLIFQTETPVDTSAVLTQTYTGTGTGTGTDGGDSDSTGRVTYGTDPSDLANPDRGFYHHTGDCDTTTFNPAVLRAYRANQHISLVMCIFYLTDFRTTAISQAALDKFQAQADLVRAAGLKMVVRFAYSKDDTGQDAPVARVLSHIDQLTPYLRTNKDVIHVLQAGFIGAWGEWYYTQNFGNAGVITATDQANRAAVVNRLLSALPTDRMIQLRTPAFKRTLYGTTPVTSTQAYTNTPVARTGHHNDCFLASADDFGTYTDPAVEYPYLAADTTYVAMGGESCAVNAPRSNCPTALDELARFHYTYFNYDYNTDVRRTWADGGCLTTIRAKLGYRFTLGTGQFPPTATGTAAIRFTVTNSGWSAPINPRRAELVLRNTSTGTVYKRTLTTNPQRWAAGTTVTVAETVSLSGIPAGSYRLLLNLPDATSTLSTRPDYAIRTANVNTWEATTGYNNLRHTLTVR